MKNSLPRLRREGRGGGGASNPTETYSANSARR